MAVNQCIWGGQIKTGVRRPHQMSIGRAGVVLVDHCWGDVTSGCGVLPTPRGGTLGYAEAAGCHTWHHHAMMRWMVASSTCRSVLSVSSRSAHHFSKKFSAMMLRAGGEGRREEERLQDEKDEAQAAGRRVSTRGKSGGRGSGQQCRRHPLAACSLQPSSLHPLQPAATLAAPLAACSGQQRQAPQASGAPSSAHRNQGDQSRPEEGAIMARSSCRLTYRVSCRGGRGGTRGGRCMHGRSSAGTL